MGGSRVSPPSGCSSRILGSPPPIFCGCLSKIPATPSPHPGAVTPPKAHRLGMQSPRVKYRSGTGYFQTTHARSGPTGEAGRVAPKVPPNLGFWRGGVPCAPLVWPYPAWSCRDLPWMWVYIAAAAPALRWEPREGLSHHAVTRVIIKLLLFNYCYYYTPASRAPLQPDPGLKSEM